MAQRLCVALDRGALFLIAPAGSGKTMALEEALAIRGGGVARVRCTPMDRDAGRLLDHLVEVLRVGAPGMADVIGDKLAGAFGPVDPGAAVRELVGEIERLIIDPLTIVFDDAEHVADDRAAAEIVGAMVVSESPALRVAVASRRPLPLRLAKLRAAGRLTEIGGAALAFSAGECDELLRLGGRPDVTEAEVRAAMEITEGWPLGLGLALAADGPGGGVIAAPGSLSELSAFLSEEVLDGLDADFRRELLKSSLPRELTPRLTAALGLDGRFLDLAVSRNLFLRPLDGNAHDGDSRLAYHPLFREFLLERLSDEFDVPELRRLHADLAAAIGEERPLEAVQHWLAAGREPEAVKTIGRHSQPLVRSSPDVVRDWIEGLSPRARSEPAIQLVESQVAMGEGRHAHTLELLRAAIEEWNRRGTRAVWTARFALAQTLIVLGRFDEVPQLAEGCDGPDTAEVVAAPMVALWAAIAIGGTGRRVEGEELLERGLAHPLGYLLEPVAIAFRAFYVDWHAGRLDDALAGAQRAIARMEEQDPVRWLPFTLWYAAYVHEARGEDATAVALLERSREATRSYGLGAYPAAVASAIKAGCDARAGRLADAEVELARAAPHVSATWHGYDLELARAELAARRGDAGETLAAAERAHVLVERGYLGERLRAATLLAPLLAGAGVRARARAVVDGALAACRGEARAPRLLALRAWLRDLEGDGGALEDLRAAWEQAGDQARYLLRGEWPRIERLVWEAVEQGLLDPGEVVAALGQAFPAGDALLDLLGHPVAAVRRASAAAVALSGHPHAAARLADLAADPDPVVAAEARRGARRLVDAPPPLAFTLFGGFALRRGGREVGEEEWERRIAARLVRYLIVHRDATVPEDLLFEAFWPERDTASARRSLQVAVSAARAVLDPPGAARGRLETRERSYRLTLRPGDVVDTDLFDEAARTALAERGTDRVAVLRSAVSLWGGDPLPEERYEGWSVAWRERLIDLHGELLAALAQSCFAVGDPFGAAAAGRRLVELDPLSEAAHRTLMTAYARSGRRGHALRQFLDCRRALVEELGVEPAEETARLQGAILAGEPV
ncbi:MAG TPA: BTAD domain-containing putative transcriptional regulator [Thermoleophilaceae bacterium]|nr:BTAD domain-containing putative transcriptional regulator [Thermoleophilaceae bacterium]